MPRRSTAPRRPSRRAGAQALQRNRTFPRLGRLMGIRSSRACGQAADAVGKWVGDTMVIDIVGFNDESWIDWPGWFHSNNMHVTEKLTRTGNAMKWEATVDDPDVLTEPFNVESRTIRLNPNPKATFIE